MQFVRLRIAGFKSFVEAAEFHIEPGLTGVVGPNGCGKSNLLEALRWVMGASSAKAMRAGGMDDVIFAGSGARPRREHAEVTLVIDNTDRTAPAAFNTGDVIEVARRIDRGEGSTYRVNGVEARARDVQLLFADASSGANSPSLVRQGQISELIAAKPANRRRILEEAAGVSGLHARRHEAELKLTGAEANLDRLDGVAADAEAQLARLNREARRAESYRRLSADIRTLKAAALHARWSVAEAAEAEAGEALTGAEREAAEAAGEAARLTASALAAAEAPAPLREAAVTAAAVLHRAAVARDGLDREIAEAGAALARAEAEVARLAADFAREAAAAEDAGSAAARLAAERRGLEVQVAAAPERLPALEAAAAAAERARQAADAELERLAAERAAALARREAAHGVLAEAERASAAAAARHAAALARSERAEAQSRAGRAALAALPPEDDAAAAAGREAMAEAERALAAARTSRDAAEAAAVAARAAEAGAQAAHRAADDGLRRLATEAEGLARLAASARRGAHAPALDAVRPAPEWEAAVSAALGDDGDAALDPAAPAHWSGAEAHPPPWPRGASPLGDRVEAPPQLAARLALTAVVDDRAEGARLARLIPAGARLVSREGDLWRWDGLVVRAEAPRPSAIRLVQRNRLLALQAEAAEAAPETARLAAAATAAAARSREAQAATARAVAAVAPAERAAASAREGVERRARAGAATAARREALAASLEGLEAAAGELREAAAPAADEAAAAAQALDAARTGAPAADDASDIPVEPARAAAGRARDAETAARATLEAERRAREGRARRLEALARDAADWARRLAAAERRQGELASAIERARSERAALTEAPAELAARRARLEDEHAAAEARRARTADALAEAEAASGSADRAARAADARAAEARERRAAAAARLEGARQRLDEARETLVREAGADPAVLRAQLSAEAAALPADPAAIEGHLRALEATRDALGAVNLRAAEEAAEISARLETMVRERDDLAGAVAKLRSGVEALNAEGRERLLLAFDAINADFQALFQTLFEGGEAELKLVESPDPLEAGLEIYACPPGKRMAAMTLMSGGEQALTATALIFAVFLSNPSPVCVLDEVDAPLDDANVDRFCRLLHAMRARTATRFIAITHNPVTMSRMDRLFGVTMAERGVSQLVSVDLERAAAMAAE